MNKKRVFIIHGWEGNPEIHWFPWLRRELALRGYDVFAPLLPGDEHPELQTWLTELAHLISEADEETYFIGHSLGCITILKYLAALPVGTKVSGAVFVAGFMSTLGIPEIENFVAVQPDVERIRTVCPRIVAFHSTDDELVSAAHARELREKLGAKLVVIENAGHFCASDGYESFPGVLRELLAL